MARRASPLTYTALIGMFPYDHRGFSSRHKTRVILFNIFIFSMSVSCRIARIILSKPVWSVSILAFFRVFVCLSIQVVQIVFFGFHLNAIFKHRKVFDQITKESTRVPMFFTAVTYIDVVYSLSLCIMFVFRCLELGTYFGIWNTITITVQNHLSFQITMLFTFFVYNITKRHELLTQRLASCHPSQVLKHLEDHYKLMARVERLNAVFAWPLVFMYGDVFISLAYYSYYITTLESEEEGQFLSYLLNSLILTWRFIMLFSTSFVTERLMASADKFNMALYVKMKNDASLLTNKMLRMYIILPKTIRLSACGFFDLGNELPTAMATAVVTYLVALVQLTE